MIDWHAPNYIDLPDLRMAVFEAGTPRDDRPSIVLCHGWPELAYSWRHIVAPLVAAGFHVLVPEQRGYGYTGPALSDAGDETGIPLYDMPHLCGDLAHLLDAYGLEKAVFVGHDWGGILIWSMPFYHPDRIAGLVGVNTPYIPRLTIDPIEAFRGAYTDDFYIVQFQDYGKSEAVFEADIARTLRFLYRRSEANAPPTNPEEFKKHETDYLNVALLKLVNTDETSWPGVELFDTEDFAYFRDGMARNGFRGGINWYRNFSRNWELSADFENKVDHPSLMICAANDRVLPPDMAVNMPKYIKDLETHIIDNCGHWTQNEQPEQLAALMCDWLTRRFSAESIYISKA